jgi:hypothetical protein
MQNSDPNQENKQETRTAASSSASWKITYELEKFDGGWAAADVRR